MGQRHEAVVNAWEERFAVPAIREALRSEEALDGLSVDQVESLTLRLLDRVRPLWLEREEIALTGGVQAAVIATLVAQPHLTYDESVQLVLVMLYDADPARLDDARSLVDDARAVGQEADPWPPTTPGHDAEPLPDGHTATVLPFRRRT
jgi:hypothetical protein